MHKTNDYIIYRNDVCKIINIKENETTGDKYYVMNPIDDDSLVISVPINNNMINIRNIISSKEANKLIDSIPNIKLIEGYNDKNLENIYRDLLNKGTHHELIQIIKTSYIRNDERIKNRKKISEKDDKYFRIAEKRLYNELSIALNKSYEQTKKHIIERVTKLSKK